MGVFCRAIICCVMAGFAVLPRDALARHKEFEVPQRIRARVDFWKDIFSQYGQHQVVIHHREYPQAVFDVVDYRDEAQRLNPVALDSYKKRETARHVNEVKEALRRALQGAPAVTRVQRRVEESMRLVPGGLEKYSRALKDDLVRSQTGIRDKFEDAIRRSGRYLPTIEKIFVQEFGLPLELTRLPFVESSFNYQAYSSAGAAGIWQFMPRTARLYMTVNNVVDERLDPEEATRAAARYLLAAYRQLGSWPLAVTSYNHGVGGVLKKVRHFGTTDIGSLIEKTGERPFGFASSNFFPSLLAAIEVYEERRVLYPGVEPEPVLRTVRHRLPRPAHVSTIAKELGIETSELKRMNYALLDRVWQGRSAIPAGYMLHVPPEFAGKISEVHFPEAPVPVIAPASSSVYGGVTYRVRKGDTLSGIGKKYGVSVSQLKALNKLSDKPLRIGQLLVVRPREGAKIQTQVSPKNLEAATKPKGAPAQVKHRVQKGDTLSGLSRKYGRSVKSIMAANKLSSPLVRVGQELIIPAK